MNANWKDKINKIMAGGCGAQVGSLLGCGLFAILLLIFAGCALSGFLTLGASSLAQQVAELSPATAPPASNLGQPIEAVEPMATAIPATPTPPADILPTPTAPPLPTTAPVAALPPTGSSTRDPSLPPPIVTADRDKANLRTGPGRAYPRIGILPQGSSLPIVGRNQESTWWLVSTIEGLAWVFGGSVAVSNTHDGIPIVAAAPPPIAVNGDTVSVGGGSASLPSDQPSPNYPGGTPTAGAVANRTFVKDTPGYKKLVLNLSAAPNSAGFHPHGDPILIAEGIKLHLVTGDGTASKPLLDGNRTYRIYGDSVWSPDGEYIALALHYKGVRADDGTIKCRPCRAVAIYRMADESLTILETPNELDMEAPRWTQDGQLLVLVHPSEPADGFTYVYNTTGQGQLAEGTYILSTSHDGQMWDPWLPGRSWIAGVSERADSYYRD